MTRVGALRTFELRGTAISFPYVNPMQSEALAFCRPDDAHSPRRTTGCGRVGAAGAGDAMTRVGGAVDPAVRVTKPATCAALALFARTEALDPPERKRSTRTEALDPLARERFAPAQDPHPAAASSGYAPEHPTMRAAQT